MNRHQQDGFEAGVMKILAPIRHAGEVGPLLEAGADEFYCGLAPEGWTRRYGAHWANRRDPAAAGVKDEAALEAIVASAGTAPVYVTLNSPHYPPGAIAHLTEFGLRLLRERDVRAVIVANMDLLLALAEAGHARQVHLSSLATVTNGGSARFYRDLGVSRIILPRHLMLTEIQHCVVEGVEFEAFVMNDGCVFEEGLCATTHAAGTFCLADGKGLQGLPAEMLDRYEFWKWTQNNCGCGSSKGYPIGPCGLCAIPRLWALGVSSLKVVGREASLQRKYASVKLAAMARDIARARGGAERIREATISRRGAASLCHSGQACYYPDVWHTP